MKKVYIKPETTEVQTVCEYGLMAASGENSIMTTTIAADNDYATRPSYGKGNSGMSNSLWDE